MRMLLTVLVLAAAALPLVAQQPTTPRDDLLRLVSPDTAICLVVQNVRERSKTVAASPLAAWVSEKYRPALGAAPELQKLKDVETLFSTFLGVSLTDLRDDIFGDAIVLTYTPGPVGKPEAEQGCVMLKARDPAKLAKLVEQPERGAEDDEGTRRGQPADPPRAGILRAAEGGQAQRVLPTRQGAVRVRGPRVVDPARHRAGLERPAGAAADREVDRAARRAKRLPALLVQPAQSSTPR